MNVVQDFLESEGIEVNPPMPDHEVPQDPYTQKRREAAAPNIHKTVSDFDKLQQFIKMDRKVLRFYAVWDDRDNMFGEMRQFVIHVRVLSMSFQLEDSLSIN